MQLLVILNGKVLATHEPEHAALVASRLASDYPGAALVLWSGVPAHPFDADPTGNATTPQAALTAARTPAQALLSAQSPEAIFLRGLVVAIVNEFNVILTAIGKPTITKAQVVTAINNAISQGQADN